MNFFFNFERMLLATRDALVCSGVLAPRDAGTVGGGEWCNLPPQLGSCGVAASQLWTVNVFHFYFCLFLHVNFGASKK